MSHPSFPSVQLEKLNHLLSLVMEHNPFYRAKLARSGLALPLADLNRFSTLCPFTCKAELAGDQETHPPYGSNLSYPLDRYTRYHQTSGTSGQPIRWLDTNESWRAMMDTWERVYHAAGVDDRDRILFAFSFGPFLGFWTAFEAGTRMGCLCLPGGGMNTQARLKLIAQNRVSVLCCTPTYALRLGEQAVAEKIPRDSVKTLIVAGEPGGGIAETRSRIASLWPNAEVIDHHGMTEVGPVSTTYRGSPQRLHLMEDSFIAEIIDPKTGAAVAPGLHGELVLTTLDRLGSPVIRYRTGDLVRRSLPEEVADGLTCYRLQGGILGRIDDMVQVRGVNVYPGALEGIVRRHEGIAEYRAVLQTVREMVELSMEIEPQAGLVDPDRLVEDLENELQSTLALRVPVTLVEEGQLPRFEMKARRWHWMDATT